ncbi:uncharacterized protein LOC128928549 [Callithrix jacchus]
MCLKRGTAYVSLVLPGPACCHGWRCQLIHLKPDLTFSLSYLKPSTIFISVKPGCNFNCLHSQAFIWSLFESEDPENLDPLLALILLGSMIWRIASLPLVANGGTVLP